MSNLDSFETARAIRELVKGIVSEELKSQRPNPRYATVQAIDRATRSCMVVYVGEDTPVRVPYNGNGPANNGQEVRIEGTQSDRVIADVRGTTETEARVASLEGEIAAREFVAGRWMLGFEVPIAADTRRLLPIATVDGAGALSPTPGVSVNTAGEISVEQEGYYQFNGAVVISGPGANASNSWNRIYLGVRIGGGAWTLIREAPEQRHHDANNSDLINTHTLADIVHLSPGDSLGVLVEASNPRTVYGGVTGARGASTGMSIHSLFLGPKPEAE